MLHTLGCSCIIDNGTGRTICHERGVKDLLRILTATPTLLAGSFIADKVVGKGAAALMTAGGCGCLCRHHKPAGSRNALHLWHHGHILHMRPQYHQSFRHRHLPGRAAVCRCVHSD